MGALERADAAGIGGPAAHLPELSGGQRQKVYLAMALAQNAQSVFLDEPTTFLDVGHQLEVMGQLAGPAGREGMSVVVVLHDLRLALTGGGPAGGAGRWPPVAEDGHR
ncbi:MAG: ATP-binding cassette domain-containing protein [Lawsonibacter sp.]